VKLGLTVNFPASKRSYAAPDGAVGLAFVVDPPTVGGWRMTSASGTGIC
jgi:hypothetical protein